MKKKVLKKEKENKGKVYNFIKNAKGLLMDGDFYRRVFLLMAVLVLLGGTVSASWIAIRNSNKSVADAKKQQEILKQIEEQQASQATAQEESKAKQDALPKAENALILTDRVTELKIEDLVTGSGDEVKEGETIKVKYQGTLADGRIFDGNLDKDPIEFALSGLIEGWQNGIPGMKVGGKRRLVIPAAQAYGSTGSGLVPADSDLVFEIELVEIVK